MAAVQQNIIALQYVKKQTPDMCLIAVQQNGYALQFIKKEFETFEICLEAIRQNPKAEEYIKNELIKEQVKNFIHGSHTKKALQEKQIIDTFDEFTNDDTLNDFLPYEPINNFMNDISLNELEEKEPIKKQSFDMDISIDLDDI